MQNRLIELVKKAHDEQRYLTSDKSIKAIADHTREEAEQALQRKDEGKNGI